jgi:hypothetical protein
VLAIYVFTNSAEELLDIAFRVQILLSLQRQCALCMTPRLQGPLPLVFLRLGSMEPILTAVRIGPGSVPTIRNCDVALWAASIGINCPDSVGIDHAVSIAGRFRLSHKI